MTRVLRRPMFRMGGNTDQGIMSGVVPRQGYQDGDLARDAEERKKIMMGLAGQRPDTSMANLLIDFGLNVASAPPTGSIFSTAAGAAKEPFQRYQTSKAKRSAYDQQVGLAAAQSAMEQRDKMAQILAGKPDPSTGLRNMFLEKAVNDGYDLPEAQRIADYQITTKAELQEKVGRNRLGGILDFDVSDEKTMKKRMPKLREKTGQFFFDPYDGKIKELVNEGGKLFFREFNSVAEITFETPDDTATVVDEKFMGEPAFPPDYIE
jgi:hypothetical protein